MPCALASADIPPDCSVTTEATSEVYVRTFLLTGGDGGGDTRCNVAHELQSLKVVKLVSFGVRGDQSKSHVCYKLRCSEHTWRRLGHGQSEYAGDAVPCVCRFVTSDLCSLYCGKQEDDLVQAMTNLQKF